MTTGDTTANNEESQQDDSYTEPDAVLDEDTTIGTRRPSVVSSEFIDAQSERDEHFLTDESPPLELALFDGSNVQPSASANERENEEEQDTYLCCGQCRFPCARVSDCKDTPLEVNRDSVYCFDLDMGDVTWVCYSATNPAAERFDVVLVDPVESFYRPTTSGPICHDHSWFKGYSWRHVQCRLCQRQLGWSFVEMPDKRKLEWERVTTFVLRKRKQYQTVARKQRDRQRARNIAVNYDNINEAAVPERVRRFLVRDPRPHARVSAMIPAVSPPRVDLIRRALQRSYRRPWGSHLRQHSFNILVNIMGGDGFDGRLRTLFDAFLTDERAMWSVRDMWVVGEESAPAAVATEEGRIRQPFDVGTVIPSGEERGSPPTELTRTPSENRSLPEEGLSVHEERSLSLEDRSVSQEETFPTRQSRSSPDEYGPSQCHETAPSHPVSTATHDDVALPPEERAPASHGETHSRDGMRTPPGCAPNLAGGAVDQERVPYESDHTRSAPAEGGPSTGTQGQSTPPSTLMSEHLPGRLRSSLPSAPGRDRSTTQRHDCLTTSPERDDDRGVAEALEDMDDEKLMAYIRDRIRQRYSLSQQMTERLFSFADAQGFNLMIPYTSQRFQRQIPLRTRGQPSRPSSDATTGSQSMSQTLTLAPSEGPGGLDAMDERQPSINGQETTTPLRSYASSEAVSDDALNLPVIGMIASLSDRNTMSPLSSMSILGLPSSAPPIQGMAATAVSEVFSTTETASGQGEEMVSAGEDTTMASGRPLTARATLSEPETTQWPATTDSPRMVGGRLRAALLPPFATTEFSDRATSGGGDTAEDDGERSDEGMSSDGSSVEDFFGEDTTVPMSMSTVSPPKEYKESFHGLVVTKLRQHRYTKTDLEAQRKRLGEENENQWNFLRELVSALCVSEEGRKLLCMVVGGCTVQDRILIEYVIQEECPHVLQTKDQNPLSKCLTLWSRISDADYAALDTSLCQQTVDNLVGFCGVVSRQYWNSMAERIILSLRFFAICTIY